MPGSDSQHITDARVLRAMAHPLRIKILNALALMDIGTATQIAEAVGDTPANCSWHMRQLAKYGFVEEAPGGTGRNRPWRMIVESRTFGTPDDDDELAVAGQAAIDVLTDYEVQALREWQRTQSREPDEWRRASGMGQSVQWMTVAELDEFNETISELFRRNLDRLSDPSKRPAGSRPVRMVAWAIPALPPPTAEAGDARPRPATADADNALSRPATAEADDALSRPTTAAADGAPQTTDRRPATRSTTERRAATDQPAATTRDADLAAPTPDADRGAATPEGDDNA